MHCFFCAGTNCTWISFGLIVLLGKVHSSCIRWISLNWGLYRMLRCLGHAWQQEPWFLMNFQSSNIDKGSFTEICPKFSFQSVFVALDHWTASLQIVLACGHFRAIGRRSDRLGLVGRRVKWWRRRTNTKETKQTTKKQRKTKRASRKHRTKNATELETWQTTSMSTS